MSDITYIPTKQGWLYLTIVLDLFDRKIVGWALSTNMTAKDTVLAAWRMAVKNRPVKGVLFHSDRGVQYTSHEFRQVLEKHQTILQAKMRSLNLLKSGTIEPEHLHI